MPGSDLTDNLFAAVQGLLALAPVPGISLIVIAIQEIYKVVQNVELRRAECRALLGYTAQVVTTINNYRIKVGDGEVKPAVDRVQGVVQEIKADMTKWSKYNRALGYLRNDEILGGIEGHKVQLDQALALVGLAHVIEQAQWNQQFAAAQKESQQLIESLNESQNEVNHKVDQILKILTHSPPTSPAHTPVPATPTQMSPARDRAATQLFDLHQEVPDAGVLPPADLTRQVQRLGNRAVHLGSMYDVWRGVWNNKYFVALKIFRPEDADQPLSANDLRRIHRQADIWRTLRHPNVLQLYGLCNMDTNSTDPITFVSPWMANQDAMRYLRANPRADRLKLIADVARGLNCLHGLGILHSCIQGTNVLIDEGGNAVLSDFTLSKVIEPTTAMTMSNGPQSMLRWWAPEAQGGQNLSAKSDVWSLAMTALEILTGKEPFYKTRAIGQVVLRLGEATDDHPCVPERSDYVIFSGTLNDDRIWNLLLSCWTTAPANRPTVDQFLDKLEVIRGTH